MINNDNDCLCVRCGEKISARISYETQSNNFYGMQVLIDHPHAYPRQWGTVIGFKNLNDGTVMCSTCFLETIYGKHT